jgi:hypothetical protein
MYLNVTSVNVNLYIYIYLYKNCNKKMIYSFSLKEFSHIDGDRHKKDLPKTFEREPAHRFVAVACVGGEGATKSTCLI